MNTYIIKNPSDIFSLIMNVYGTLEESVQFISDNISLIPSFSSEINTLAGQVVYYNAESVITYLPPKSVLTNPAPVTTGYTWMGRDGQNMFDVSIQTYGILDKQIKLLSDNNLEMASPVYMQEFNYDSVLIANSNIWNRSTGIGIIFSTGSLPDTGSFDSSFEFLSYEKTTNTGI